MSAREQHVVRSAPLDAIAVSGLLIERLQELGVDPGRILARAGLPASRFVPDGKLTTREFFDLWRAVDEEPGARDLGIRLAEGRRPSQYDVASAAALRSADLADALRRFARYKRLSCPEHVRVEVVGGEASLRFHWVLADAIVPRTLVDASFTSFMALARRGTGRDLRPIRVELARRASADEVLGAHLGCALTFDAPFDRLVLPAATLAIPFVTHDPVALDALVPGLDAALDRRAGPANFDDEVRLAIVRAMCGERPSVERVARDLRVSARTLQRRLEDAGVTYQGLLDEVRCVAARRLLANTNLEATEVAFLLGFEEPNSFVRAFRSWEGRTPTRFRGERRATT
jgi:AraC-like DNA-binding protein